MKILLSLATLATVTLPLSAASEIVNASSFGWNPTNATKCLQSAIDSGAKKIVIDKQTGDWIVEPIFLRTSGQEVVVADGVTVRALKGAFKHRSDCLFRITGNERIAGYAVDISILRYA